MIDISYDKRFAKLRKMIFEMVNITENQILTLLNGIGSSDNTLLDRIKKNEMTIDKYDVKIDKISRKILALNNPIACDLRFVLTAYTVSSKLELISDNCQVIAENLKELDFQKPIFFNELNANEYFSLIESQITLSFESFIQSDSDKAIKAILQFESLNTKYMELSKLIKKEIIERGNQLSEVMTFYEVCNYLLQISKISKSLAEEVYFMVESKIIKHVNLNIDVDIKNR
ncbi:hypothetical protein MASR1M45_17130 [Candidatus Kapaibacterium sp.]